MKKTARIAALTCAAALTLAACGSKPAEEEGSDDPTNAETTSTTEESPAVDEIDFKACMVSDSGGFDDKSFNQTSHDGLKAAAADLGVQTGEVESQSDSEYADNIKALVSEGCNSITTVGFLLGDATEAAAKKNKKVNLSIVDFAYEKAPKKLKGLVFNTAEPSFLAGYVAAAKSESGTVGTFGGMNIPTVTSFMTGFKQGVDYYNSEEGGEVKVLGWNGKKGTFTDDFEDKAKGQTVAEQMIAQGADVIFPVAGPAGLGGLQAAQDADVKGIWVDTDGGKSAAEYCDVLLTSVMKGMDVAVEEAIKEGVEGTFTNELYVGTLENGGVGLAPLSDDAADLQDKIDEITQKIIDGEITTG